MFEIKRVGESQEPVVVIDGFHPEPDALRAAAIAADFARHAPFYPGVQAPCDPSHLQVVADVLTQVFKEVFGITRGVSLVQCAYSLVTTPDADLQPIQRVPHIDTPDGGRIALLHYLGTEAQGGTKFYRHRATGLEVLDTETYATYQASVTAEGLPKPGYMRGSDARFEEIAHIPAAPNRAILYRSALLHSGDIPANALLSADPEDGRLTLNSFFQAK